MKVLKRESFYTMLVINQECVVTFFFLTLRECLLAIEIFCGLNKKLSF